MKSWKTVTVVLAWSCDEIPKSSALSDKLLFENGTAIVKGIFSFYLPFWLLQIPFFLYSW